MELNPQILNRIKIKIDLLKVNYVSGRTWNEHNEWNDVLFCIFMCHLIAGRRYFHVSGAV